MTTDQFITDLPTVHRIADAWRALHSPGVGSPSDLYMRHGFVIVYHGRGVGWIRDLSEPQKWCPDAIAVPAYHGATCFVALGGNVHDGAARWEELTEGKGGVACRS